MPSSSHNKSQSPKLPKKITITSPNGDIMNIPFFVGTINDLKQKISEQFGYDSDCFDLLQRIRFRRIGTPIKCI